VIDGGPLAALGLLPSGVKIVEAVRRRLSDGSAVRHHERVTRGRSIERPNEHLALPQVLNKWVAFTAVHGAENGLTDPEGAPLIPPNVVAALVSRHASREHWMFGEGLVAQVAAEELQDRYVLLLQLGRDPALNWTVGEMGPLQYWS